MYYTNYTSRKTLFCLLIALASSGMCYVILTSPVVALRSPTYLLNSFGTPANLLLGRGEHHNHATGRKAEMTNCSCLKEVDLASDNGHTVEQHINSSNQTTSKKSPESHRLILPKGKTFINSSITGLLWNFEEEIDQQLYLFENLLKQKWRANSTRSAILRQELAKYRSELEDNSKIILHQKNVKVGEVLKYVFSKNGKAMTRDIYKYLPKSDLLSRGSRYRSCAVVGNSGAMLKSRCGKDIDEHDFLFRCNLAPLSPFKDDAGSKSNFTTMNPSIIFRNYQYLKNSPSIKKFREDISQYDGLVWIPCYAFGINLPVCIKAISRYNKQKPKMVCGNPTHQKSVIEFWKERELKQRLSTGFYLVTTALQLCDEVDLYGFWPFPARYSINKTEVPYHYFDDLSADGANAAHSMDKEFSLLVQLHTLGILRLHVGPCS